MPIHNFKHVLTTALRQEEQGCIDGCVSRWKASFAAILLAEGLLFGLLVYLLKTTGGRRGFDMAFKYGNALSAGVFPATRLLHILPETVALLNGEHEEGGEEGEEGHDEEEGHGFPWAYFVTLMSFYAFFAIERIILPRLLGKGAACGMDEDTERGKLEGARSSEDHEHNHEYDHEHDDLDSQNGGFRSEAFLAGLLQIIGISAHSLFESMALGLSNDFVVVLHIFIATAAHRWATAVAIAFRLVRKLSFAPFLVLLAVFSTMVPVGVAIGAALTALSAAVQGVLFGVSAGTFLDIGVVECLSGVARGRGLARKSFVTLLGVAVVVGVTAVLAGTGVEA